MLFAVCSGVCIVGRIKLLQLESRHDRSSSCALEVKHEWTPTRELISLVPMEIYH